MDGMNPDSLSRHAQHIWSMLDDMVETNPAAYRKFIEQQMKEAKEQTTPPEPHMCVHVTLLKKPTKPLFINFCSWKRVPEPKSSQDPVPVIGTPLREDQDEKGSFVLTSVAFNPKILQEFGRNAQNAADGDTLVQLALDYIEHEQKIKVTRTYTILPVETPFKGEINLLRQSFLKLFQKNKEHDHQVEELEKTFGPLSTKEKSSLLSELSKVANRSSEDSGHSLEEGVAELKLPGSSGSSVKKGLIEVIGGSKCQTPSYSLVTQESDRSRQLVLKVELPGVGSVSECQLEISEDDVVLEVADQYELKVKLPHVINDELSTAKFSRKHSVLTLVMPLRN